MANAVNVGGLTLNPQEAQSVSEFIMARTIMSPALQSYATIYNGIKMNTQVVIAGNMGMSGLKSANCGRQSSGAESVLSEKFLNPVNVSDTFAMCGDDIDGEFKPFKNKVQSYKDLYDFEGSDIALLLAAKIEGSIVEAVDRLIWASDVDMEEATSSTSGVVPSSPADFYTKFYTPTDGVWKQIVEDSTIERFTITKNAQTTVANQALAAGESVTIFNAVIKNAKTQLRQSLDKQLLVSRDVFDNYVDYLISKGENNSIQYTVDGIASVKYKGIPVINMEGAWISFETILQNTTSGVQLDPHKVILTTPSNIAVGTLQESGIKELDTHFDWLTKKTYIAYGFTVNAIVVEADMISVAY